MQQAAGVEPPNAAFVTAQMSAKAGLKMFGTKGADALMKELGQLIVMKVMSGCNSRELTPDQKKNSLKYLMFLKEKRCGRIKGRGCADGRKQRVYKTKIETSSPTVSIESLMLSCMIDAMEAWDIATCDIPGAFMQADIDEEIHVKFDGELVDLLLKVDPTLGKYVTMERGKKVLYTLLNKALYGTVQASLLFWKRLSSFLIDKHGYKRNPYDWCVVNKTINGKQSTIVWYVDDLKISHVDTTVVDEQVQLLNAEFGKEMELTIKRGKIHDYLGIQFDFTKQGKVVMTMNDFIEELLKECPDDLMKGTSTTPAAAHLFTINPECDKLDSETATLYHHLTAKLLYLSKRTRPDLQVAVSFLSTRVLSPDTDDWKKLGRCLRYLHANPDLPHTLESDGTGMIRWWVDASYGVHHDMKSHTGATMSMGKGCAYSMFRRQRLNTRSSTEAELVGVNDAMGLILWTRLFLEAQGFVVNDNVVYQDNQSAILLENNGKMSSSKRTRHLEIRYFFVTDNVHKKHLRIEYCPTDDMIADFFTKPLQGAKFRRFRAMILNLPGAEDVLPARKECVATSDVGDAAVNQVTSAKPPDGSLTTRGYIVPGRLDDEPVKTTSASSTSASWVEVVRRRKPVVKQSGAVLTLFTKRK
jgi:Reverse transcriptase (RNA-dependent DNA polymerase)